MSNLSIKPFYELLSEHFFIPRYQRGYRWGKQEIEDLLNDILQYSELVEQGMSIDRKISKFYCLQPVVVKRKKWLNSFGVETEGWELIDGQQRLTSLYLILSYLESIRKDSTFAHVQDKELIYSLDYETRDNSQQFFRESLFKNGVNSDNIDYFHISNAYDYISKWFEKYGNKHEILKRLLNKTYNISVIWYEVYGYSENEHSSIELFTRLNEGKIPLTDTELIKALLLQADHYPENEQPLVQQRLFEIASEWDRIESELQNDSFWFFINEAAYKPASRIELIFHLLADRWNKKPTKLEEREEKGETSILTTERYIELLVVDGKEAKPKNYVFMVTEQYMKDKMKDGTEKYNENTIETVNQIWLDVKTEFSKLKEWYDNPETYHLVGFLLATTNSKEKTIEELVAWNGNKKDFIIELKKKIAKQIKINKKDKETGHMLKLNELQYGAHNTEIINILLLFNIITQNNDNKENARFPFHLFKEEKTTSIEHIHPQNPEGFNEDEERAVHWIDNALLSLQNILVKSEDQNSIIELIDQLYDLRAEYNAEEFKKVFEKTLKVYNSVAGIKEGEIHTFNNLALVDKDTNSKLNNSFFDRKRQILLENSDNKFIPACTINAFTKKFSKSPSEMIFWSESDRNDYYGKIERVYNSFVKLLN